MKPEHFIYKSDGLYYMPWLPTEPNYISYGKHGEKKDNPNFGLAYSVYEKALERAKEEAVLVTDPYVYQIAMHRYFQHFIDNSKTPQDNFAMCASIGQVYILNMEEEIDVLHQYHSSTKHYHDAGWEDCTEEQYNSLIAFGNVRIIARIAEPKKQEESEDHLWYFVFQTYGGEFYHAAPRDEAAIISRIKREFEIKRKPL